MPVNDSRSLRSCQALYLTQLAIIRNMANYLACLPRPQLQTLETKQTEIFPLELADRCVKCGLCLPHCPTYGLARNEGDSPRGRISLMQGLARGQLPVSEALLTHLDTCLACRSCERVCPATVPYGQLIDAVRADLTGRGADRPVTARLLAAVLSRPGLMGVLVRILNLARWTGLVALLAQRGPQRIARIAQMIPLTLPRWQQRPANAVTEPGEAVSLFTGCMLPHLDSRTLGDAVAVLQAMGLQVQAEKAQRCCGALHLHDGRREQAAKLARANCEAFKAAPGPVLGLASGCTATLVEYGQLLDNDQVQSVQFLDVMQFVAEHSDRLPVLALPEPVTCAVQIPCTQKNVLRNEHIIGMLLDKVDNLIWRPLDAPDNCCGAAGDYMIRHQDIANELAGRHVAALATAAPDYLLTTNIGCALHLQAAVARLPAKTRVLHPLSILAMALPG